jgi:hypothetical protein
MGFLIDETKDALLIASTISMGSTNARMHIPKAWIKKRKVIKYEDKSKRVHKVRTNTTDSTVS